MYVGDLRLTTLLMRTFYEAMLPRTPPPTSSISHCSAVLMTPMFAPPSKISFSSLSFFFHNIYIIFCALNAHRYNQNSQIDGEEEGGENDLPILRRGSSGVTA